MESILRDNTLYEDFLNDVPIMTLLIFEAMNNCNIKNLKKIINNNSNNRFLLFDEHMSSATINSFYETFSLTRIFIGILSPEIYERLHTKLIQPNIEITPVSIQERIELNNSIALFYYRHLTRERILLEKEVGRLIYFAGDFPYGETLFLVMNDGMKELFIKPFLYDEEKREILRTIAKRTRFELKLQGIGCSS